MLIFIKKAGSIKERSERERKRLVNNQKKWFFNRNHSMNRKGVI
jgi:hypothetical protein